MIWCERSIKSCLLWPPEAHKIRFRPDGEQQTMLSPSAPSVPSLSLASSCCDTDGPTKLDQFLKFIQIFK